MLAAVRLAQPLIAAEEIPTVDFRGDVAELRRGPIGDDEIGLGLEGVQVPGTRLLKKHASFSTGS